MRLYKNLKPLLLATLMLLMTQAGSLYGFNDSMNDQNPVLNELEGQFFVGGTSLSPAFTNVTLINNTAMSPITFNWTGSGMTSGVPSAIGPQGRPYQNMAYEMDSNDNHHIMHYGGGSLHGLYYTTDTSGSWTTSLVEAGSTYGLGYHSDIAIDSNGDLHVVYSESSAGGMNYTSFSNGVWSTPITIDGSVGRQMKMDIDSNDNLHIVSNRYANGGATNYTTNSGGSWSSETVHIQNSQYPQATDIALDSNGDIFILLGQTRHNSNSRYLYLINNTGGSWNSQTLASGSYSYNVELTIDSNDVKHVYYDAGGGNGSTQANIVVINDASGSWSGNLLPHPQGQPIQLGDMTMGSNGTIHIVYKWTWLSTTYFYYATNISGSWVFKELTNTTHNSVIPTYEVLELDSQGNLHYFFRNGSSLGNGTLFHLVENGVSTVGGSGGGSSGSTTSQANGTPWQVADINPGAGGSGAGAIYPSAVSKGFVLVGTTVYFSASDGTNGSELWAYNSSNGTTWLVADINPSGSSYSGRHGGFNLVGTTLYFDADDGTTGRELWAHNTSNGTTWRVANINSGDSNTARFYGITLVGTTLFFDADDGGLGRELWAHDTSNGTTWMTFDIYNGSTGGLDGSQTPFAVVGTTLYFEAQSGTQYEHLWAHNTSNGTSWLVSDLVQDPGAFAGFTIIGDTLYFDATAYYSPYTGNELWAHNTSNGTTWIAADVAVGPNGGNPGDLTGFHVIGDVILFDCSPSFGSSGKLGAYNTSNGTIWLINSSYKNIGSYLFKAMGNTLYFGSRINGGSNTLLYAYSTTNTTIWDIPIPGSYSNQPGFLPGFSKSAAIVGDVLYFDARRAVYGDRGLAAYNESNGTAWMVGDRSDYTLPYSGFHPTLVGGMLLFQATDGSNGTELWALGSGNVASGPSNGPVSSATCEISPTLPVGITLTQGTCTISGTPTVVQNGTTYTIWANESGYSDWATVVISVISGDSDGDGYPDIIDAFPNDPTEWIDTDGDGIGNNADPDDDNDNYNDTNEIDCLSDPLDNVSIPLDNDLDGICDELDPDDDNDGLEDVNETASLPATDPFLPDTDGDGICDGPVAINGTCTAGPDAFPTDPSEWLDTDGDGIGNNADTDDDGDGLDDVIETNTGIYVGANDTGTDPLLPDTDGDGICDGPIAVDPICTIGPDAFPMDPSEWVDTDGDGIGNNADPDDDGDGLDDVNETASLPPTDPLLADTDGDGICDGPIAVGPICLAGPDAFPTDPSAYLDTDGDGMPDTLNGTSTSDPVLIEDLDDDNDGLDDMYEVSSAPPTDPLLVDTDGDGICDGPIAFENVCIVVDRDGDGIADEFDDFPDDPSAYLDTDGDGMPDTLNGTSTSDPVLIEDLDDDNDGLDDVNETSSAPPTDPLLVDTDGDGYCDGPVAFNGTCTVGPDVFPTDPSEWSDADGDEIGDNADLDDDNDGYSDINEIDCLTDPLDNASIPLDNDLDGICDMLDPDDDNDGLDDVYETSSTPATDPFLPDTDGDGICDGPIAVANVCIIVDRDGDGVADEFDDFPDDPSAYLDTDGDGRPDTLNGTSTSDPVLIEDLDDDNDGLDDVIETSSIPATNPLMADTDGDGYCDGPTAVDPICLAGPDAFPTDISEWLDTDGDGYGNNADTDDDGDGWSDSDETSCGTDPLSELSVPSDKNEDGICDALEKKVESSILSFMPYWACCIMLLLLLLLLVLFSRSAAVQFVGPEPENTESSPKFVSGSGTRDDPFVLKTKKKVEPGSIVHSKEVINITKMTENIDIALEDLNEDENGFRFSMVDHKWDDKGIKILNTGDEGEVSFSLTFDDSIEPTLAGGNYDGMIRIGRASVYLSWPIEVEPDPVYQPNKKEMKQKEKVVEEIAIADATILQQVKDVEKTVTLTKKEKREANLARVAKNAESINFSVLGVASVSEKDDLQKIKGIGPFIEQKLNALGIYTFTQLSRMTPEIEEQVSIAIEFFPGRAKRDQWVKQVIEFEEGTK